MVSEVEKSVLELINTRKSVTTTELCSKLGISESTTRRVLLKLSQRGLIQRYHGGGHSNHFISEKRSLNNRFDLQSAEKDRIAKAAIQFIEPNQTIVMMGGTTVYRMCKYIKDLKITVITTSMLVFDELKDMRNIDIILLGGKYNPDEMEVGGVLTNTSFRLLRADSLFMGTTRFHPLAGFLTREVDSVELYRSCINATDRRYVLVDSTKLSTKGSAVTATCDSIDCLVTDDGLSLDVAGEFNRLGVSVIRA